MNDAPLPDPLEQFLQHPPTLPAEMRDRLLRETSAALRQPRRWRTWAAAVGAAAALAAAAVSVYFGLLADDTKPTPPMTVERRAEPPIEIAQPAAVIPELPYDAEWRAFDTEDDRQRARLYFRAGDLYMTQAQDVESALRCYHQGLLSCQDGDLETDVNDSWLLMALKRDRRNGNDSSLLMALKRDRRKGD